MHSVGTMDDPGTAAGGGRHVFWNSSGSSPACPTPTVTSPTKPRSHLQQAIFGLLGEGAPTATSTSPTITEGVDSSTPPPSFMAPVPAPAPIVTPFEEAESSSAGTKCDSGFESLYSSSDWGTTFGIMCPEDDATICKSEPASGMTSAKGMMDPFSPPVTDNFFDAPAAPNAFSMSANTEPVADWATEFGWGADGGIPHASQRSCYTYPDSGHPFRTSTPKPSMYPMSSYTVPPPSRHYSSPR